MKLIILIALMSSLSACSVALKPKFVNRETVMEKESAVQWSSFEKKISKKFEERGPSFFSKESTDKRRKKLLNVINSEFNSTVKK